MGGAADELTDSVMQFVTNMRGELLGSIGLAVLVYTVITDHPKGRRPASISCGASSARAASGGASPNICGVMIVGPILLAVAIGLLGSAEHSPFAQWLHAVPPLAGIAGALGELVPYVIVTVAFTFMYSFIPNTRVEFRAALIGGVTAGIIWALVGKVFTAVILYSSHMVAVYTGFAIVLTTLIWVYLSWLILLIGAQLAFYRAVSRNTCATARKTIELTGQRPRTGGAVDHVPHRAATTAGQATGPAMHSPPNSTFRASRSRRCSRAWNAPD